MFDLLSSTTRCLGVVALRGLFLASVMTVILAFAEPSTGMLLRPAAEGPLAERPRHTSVAADYTDEYRWWQGAPSVKMKNSVRWVCFLTRIGGKFEGGGEYVRAFIWKGDWWLGGASQQKGVNAGARCVSITGRMFAYSDEFSWAQGQSAVFMGDAATRVCFLTRVGGGFEGYGERVEILKSSLPPYGNGFYLGGKSKQSGVHARARCIVYGPPGAWYLNPSNGVQLYPPYAEPRAANKYYPNVYLYLEKKSSVCFLVGMSGKFEGGGEYIQTVLSAYSNKWYEHPSSMQVQPAQVTAGCVY